MSNIARSLAPRIHREVLKLKDRTLLEGAMAASALVAMADRKIRLEEDLAVGAVLSNLELLQVYDPEFALTLHSGFVERLRSDHDKGREFAMESVRRCNGDIEAAELLVKVGIAIAKADSEFAREELQVIEDICEAVGIEGLDALGLAGLRPAVSRRPH